MKSFRWKRCLAGILAAATLTVSMGMPVAAEQKVVRNEKFTTNADMQKKTGSKDADVWFPTYLTKIEGIYWNFSTVSGRVSKKISMNLASNAYQNLEMFLDNGYLMDYHMLQNYCEDYKERAEREDAYYLILTDCLKNPYLLNKPEAEVTATTYNGRDYSAVFDAKYYYTHNPDLQKTIGNNPQELLRHFVECGINEGRRGNAEFDVHAYKKQIDADVCGQMLNSGIEGASDCLGVYSYSLANYYGKYMGHYEYETMYEENAEEAEEMY